MRKNVLRRAKGALGRVAAAGLAAVLALGVAVSGPVAASALEATPGGSLTTGDGVTLTPDMSTSDINDWSGALIRRVLEAFNGEVAFTMIQSDAETFKMALGDDYVEAQDADASHGNQVMAKFGAHLPDPEAWVFKMKDGAARILICLPNAQVTSMDEVTFNATDPIGWALTLSCYPDESGVSIYVLCDDGQIATA